MDEQHDNAEEGITGEQEEGESKMEVDPPPPSSLDTIALDQATIVITEEKEEVTFTAAEPSVVQDETIITTTTTTTPAAPPSPATATPPQPPRPILSGVMVGLFVVIHPDRQKTKFNLKRELEFLGIHQRDIGPNEEVQISLEQAFYLLENLKRLEVYTPPDANGDQIGPLYPVAAWEAFSSISDTFVRSVGSYRYFRNRGFVVHGGLNLGLDYMLYRGSPQRYHAEFGVFLRYPSSETKDDEKPFSLRDLHLLYRLVGEVRKTLVIGHVRLGEVSTTSAIQENGEEEHEGGGAPSPAAIQMQKWYTGLTVYEVAVTPWRANTPLARLSKAAKSQNAQLKRGGGRKRGRRQSR